MSEYRVRASSWGKLFDCAHKWEGEHLLGMRMPSGPRALLGTAIHAGTAVFDQARLEGSPIRPDDASTVLIHALHHPEYEVDWRGDDLKPADAETIGLNLLGRYCTEISPHYDFVAVEMETKPLRINCGGDITVILTGTLDRSRVRRGTGGVGISDVKTGGAAVTKGDGDTRVAKTQGHRPQLGTYELLYEHTTGIATTEPAEIIGLKTKGKPETGTALVHGARELMVGTDAYPGLIQFAADMFRSGLFPPNPSSHLCSARYCARWNRCSYHD